MEGTRHDIEHPTIGKGYTRHRQSQPIDMRIPRLRLLIILFVVIVCVLVTNRHIESVGHQIDYRLDGFAGKDIGVESLQVSPPELVRVTAVEVGRDGIPVVTLEANKPGDGMAIVSADDGGMGFAVAVKPNGVIVADSVEFSGWESVGWGTAVCFAIATIVFGWNFVWLWRKSWYGYEMLAYLGLAVFCACQTMEFASVMMSGDAHAFSELAVLVATIGDRFLLMTLPAVLVIAAVVSISNVFLIRREGRGLTNMLGIALGVVVTAFLVGWEMLTGATAASSVSAIAELGMNSVVSTVGSFGMTMFLATCVCSYLAACHRPSQPRDYVMVLGCGLRPDGSLTPLLAGRVDAAIGFAKEQAEAGMGLPKLVPSGGQGPDEIMPEAEAMRRHAVDKGIPEEAILPETQSTNTRENFAFSKSVIADDMRQSDKNEETPSVAFATTNYHVFRSYVYAHMTGMEAEGIASPTKWYFWPNAFLREFVGLVAGRPVAIVAALLVIIVIYGTAEYVVLLG